MPDDVRTSDQQPPVEKVKRPASQYYWGDWWKDKGLHSCSLTARGLWHEMNCLMHEGEPYGHLTLNGKPMTVQQLANQCRITPTTCKKLLDELIAAGVPSVDPITKALFSRRMVRDERIREARAKGGKEGAEHGIKGAEHGAKGGRPTKKEGGQKTPLPGEKNPPPSSSSSPSTSSSEENPSGSKAAAAPPPARPKKDPKDVAMVAATLGVPRQLLEDWLIVRKAKSVGAVTGTVIEQLMEQAQRAGISVEEAIRICCARGWAGFNANWLRERGHQPAGTGTAYRNERDARVANGAPGVAATPAVRVPGTPLTLVEDVSDERQQRLAQG